MANIREVRAEVRARLQEAMDAYIASQRWEAKWGIRKGTPMREIAARYRVTLSSMRDLRKRMSRAERAGEADGGGEVPNDAA